MLNQRRNLVELNINGGGILNFNIDLKMWQLIGLASIPMLGGVALIVWGSQTANQLMLSWGPWLIGISVLVAGLYIFKDLLRALVAHLQDL